MNLSERDQKYIWHPLTQHQTARPPLPIIQAKGAVLRDENGKEYIDGIASWYTAMYGHCNPIIASKVALQMLTLDQVVFTGFTHEPAVELSEKLLGILPDSQKKVFFNDNGSTAVEAGIKMALQYHYNKGIKRDTLIAFEEGFHGDTFGAMSVSGLSVYNGPFEDFFLNVVRIPTPQKENIEAVLKKLQDILEANQCAGFIYEPLVQGAAGMKFYEPKGLDKIIKLCKENDVVCIADEVMTGFGKTGKLFASQHLESQPDIICLSKALTAGMVAMSITSCTQNIFNAFLDNDIAKGFFHAHTYSANPLGCAAAIAGIDLLCSQEIQDNIKRINKSHKAFKSSIDGNPKIKSSRVLGVIIAIDLEVTMERYGETRNKLFDFFMKKGVFLRPLGNTIYVLPPYVISNIELQKIYDTINESLSLV